MPVHSPTGTVLLLIDDDLLSREVIVLLAAEEGFIVHAADSGQAALQTLTGPHAPCPDVVLTDMQMPGLSGDPLARKLRAHCGPSTVLLAMSGSPVPPTGRASFDDFLLKPFGMPDLHAAIAQTRAKLPVTPRPASVPQPSSSTLPPINQAIFASLSEGMPAAQLIQLYNMCLDDAERRLESMRKAALDRDAAAFFSGAHAIKGGCGMVGAAELAAMATHMESTGLPAVGDQAPFDDFLEAAQRVRRMLDAQTKQTSFTS